MSPPAHDTPIPDDVARRLDEILTRLDALDEATRLLAQAVQDGPALVGALVDEIDRRYAADAPMPDLDALVEKAPSLAAHAINRHTLEALEHILARLDALDKATRLLAQAVQDGPALVGALVDEMDRRYAADAPMPDLDALVEKAPSLAAHAINRRTLEALEHILTRLDALDKATRLLAQAVQDGPALVGALVDEVDRFAQRSNVDLDAATTNALATLERLLDLVQSPAFTMLLSSGALSPTTLDFVVKAADALETTYTNRHAIEDVSPIGMFKVLNDPDVKRAVGFLLATLKQLGQSLR